MKVQSKKLVRDDNPARWISISLISITLYFQANLTDPFNSPKFWILLLIASWFIGYIFHYKIIFNDKTIKQLLYIIVFFIMSNLGALSFTDFKYTAFFGESLRRNGFLSYLSLAVLMLATAMFIRLYNIKKIYNSALCVAMFLGFYSLLQTTGNDFISWNNQYNPIIATLGNPNFDAATMAIVGVIVFSVLFIERYSKWIRLFSLIIICLLIFVIYRSEARQGLLTLIIGTGCFVLIYLFSKNARLGIACSVAALISAVFVVMGMLQFGPLEKYLYKPSVSVRGYYWRAGIEMFQSKPWFGIGLDRYGSYFKDFREVSYPLRYGYDITSTNAHNTFIQFFATGGIFVGISYIVLNLFVLIKAFKGLKHLKGIDRLLLSGLFSAWVSFHAQSLISIDNLGISVWGWILAGAIIGISSNEFHGNDTHSEVFIKKHNQVDIKRALVSIIMVFPTILLVTFLYRGEVETFKTKVQISSQNPIEIKNFTEMSLKAANLFLNDPAYVFSIGLNLLDNGITDDGTKVLLDLSRKDPRNLDVLNVLAIVNTNLNNNSEAIKNRESISNLDPWNSENYLALGKLYKLQGRTAESSAILKLILSFDNNSDIAEIAKTELA